jgi:hypothetical protein
VQDRPAVGIRAEAGSSSRAPRFGYAPAIGLAQWRLKASNEKGFADTYADEFVTGISLIGIDKAEIDVR